MSGVVWPSLRCILGNNIVTPSSRESYQPDLRLIGQNFMTKVTVISIFPDYSRETCRGHRGEQTVQELEYLQQPVTFGLGQKSISMHFRLFEIAFITLK